MKTEKKLSRLINSGLKKSNGLTEERETLLIEILCMVQTLNLDHKLRECAKSLQKSFPEYGQMI